MTDLISHRPPAANDDTMNLEAAADFLHLGYKAMKVLVDTGEVPALSCNQKHTVLLRADLVDYVRTKGREQAEARKRKKQPAIAPVKQRGKKKALPNLDLYELTTGGRQG